MNMKVAKALRAMQSGVALEKDDEAVLRNNPEMARVITQLRVGLNAVRCDQVALVQVLVAKGVLLPQEYEDERLAELLREVRRYERRLSVKSGTKVRLA